MIKMTKAAAIFAILMGVLMLLVWGALLVTGQEPEVSAGTPPALFLLAAEFLTAFSLIVGGYGLYTRRKWGLRAALVALGMLLYCVIFSIGVFAGRGIAPAVAWFIFVTVAAAFFVGHLLREVSV
jgi:hypothetical protein